MRKKRKLIRTIYRFSLPEAILNTLLNIAGKLIPVNVPYEQLGQNTVAKWRYNQAVKYLAAQGQIKLLKKRDRLFFKLTRKGRLQALLDKIKAAKGQVGPWDGKWRMVIWDIPETSSHARDRIRYFLKQLGFYRLQLSVFIRPFPIPRDAVNYLKESGLIKFIRFLRVDQIDDHHKLLNYYNLRKSRNRLS